VTVFWIWVFVVGLTFIIGHKKAGSAYVRTWRVETTQEQMQQIYLVLGCAICVLAVVGLAVSALP
jgi:hypothetical protein